MMAKERIIFMWLILLFLVGCASRISQDRAEWIAQAFIEKNVKFFATDEEEKRDLQAYSIASIDSYNEEKSWVVVAHIESQFSNETKKGDLVVKIDPEGNVVEFNGNKIR